MVGPNGMFKDAPNPNAARLFQSFCFSGGMPAAHLRCRRAALGASAGQGEGRATSRFKEIKTMKEDAAGVEKIGEEIKARYTKIFKV